MSLVSENVERLLGVDGDASRGDLVATRSSGLLEFGSKVVAVISPKRGVTDLF